MAAACGILRAKTLVTSGTDPRLYVDFSDLTYASSWQLAVSAARGRPHQLCGRWIFNSCVTAASGSRYGNPCAAAGPRLPQGHPRAMDDTSFSQRMKIPHTPQTTYPAKRPGLAARAWMTSLLIRFPADRRRRAPWTISSPYRRPAPPGLLPSSSAPPRPWPRW
jgi:hypothetical protein